MSASCRTYFVCPAPPCPNGKLHLGHIAGVYLLADIFVRFQRMAGRTAYLVTGADEHGSYTLVKARKLGRPVEEVATMHTEEILNCLNVMGIEVDAFVSTSSKDHHLVRRGTARPAASSPRTRLQPDAVRTAARPATAICARAADSPSNMPRCGIRFTRLAVAP